MLVSGPGSHIFAPEQAVPANKFGPHSSTGRGSGRVTWGASAALFDAGGPHEISGGQAAGARSGSSDDRQSTSTAADVDSEPGSASGGASTGGVGAGASGPAAGGEHGGVCSDTCQMARNGICEDGSNMEAATVGGRTVGLQVACDFGTDCSDCGAYKGVVPTWGTDAGFQGPIDFLSRQGVKVWARRVSFEPYFLFAYTDPKEDLDVSEQMDRVGCMELGVVHVFQDTLAGKCGVHKAALEQLRAQGKAGDAAAAAGLPPQPLVVDVGANFGYFAVYAAVLGCRVVAVEPVPRFLAFLHWNLAANGLSAVTLASAAAQRGAPAPAVTVVPRVVMHVPNMINVTVAAPRKGVWGTASVAGAANNVEQDLEMISVPTISLDEIVGKDYVELLKVDVEGYEPSVMRSGSKALGEQRVHNIVFEYSPGMPEHLERMLQTSEREKLPVRADEPPLMLQSLIENGYTLLHMPDNFAKSGYLPQLAEPLPAFEEVLKPHVLEDIQDVTWFRNYSGPGVRCPWPPELARINPVWEVTGNGDPTSGGGCFRAPDDSNPKGFRAMFAYNTNLWAAKNRSALHIGGPVGLFAPDQDDTVTWWSEKRHTQGVGNRACPYLPADQLVRSRCRCTKPEVCGLEQEALLKALKEGRMPRRPAGSTL